MFEFCNAGFFVIVDPSECYVDDDSYVMIGHVDSPVGSGRLLAVGDARGEVEYAVEGFDGEGDLDVQLPLAVFMQLSAMAVCELREETLAAAHG